MSARRQPRGSPGDLRRVLAQLWQFSQSCPLRLALDVGVVAADGLAIVADDVHGECFRHAGILEEAGGGMAQRVEGDFADGAPERPALAGGFFAALFGHTGVKQDGLKLLGQPAVAAFLDRDGVGVREERGRRFITGWHGLQMDQQRGSQWNRHSTARLGGHESQFLMFGVDAQPDQAGNVLESLARVDAKQNDPFPLVGGVGQDRLSSGIVKGRRSITSACRRRITSTFAAGL